MAFFFGVTGCAITFVTPLDGGGVGVEVLVFWKEKGIFFLIEFGKEIRSATFALPKRIRGRKPEGF